MEKAGLIQLEPTARQLALDVEGGLFRDFKAYPTSYGIELQSSEQALQFNNVHEGLHLGYMMALAKAIR